MFQQMLEVDEELANAIEAVSDDFGGYIKRGFTNVEIRRYQSPLPKEIINFDDAFYKDRQNEITIRKLRLSKPLTSRMTDVTPDLGYNVLNVIIELNDVKLEGEYEAVNSKQLEMLSITHHGNLEIAIENVQASGRIGLTQKGDAFVSTNFDLEFKTGAVRIKAQYLGLNGKKITSEVIKDSIEDSIVNSFKLDLIQKIKKSIQKQLNTVLANLSVSDTFQGNPGVVKSFIERKTFINRFANNVVDTILSEVKGYVKRQRLSVIRIPDYETTFSQPVGPITFSGGFHAIFGEARNLSTVKRTSDFSISVNNKTGLVTIFGGLGLDELNFEFAKYKAEIWNIGPSGDIKGRTSDNSLALKITTKSITDIMKGKFNYTIHVDRLDDVTIQATGLGGPLDWLLSRTVTWMAGNFKSSIIPIIENQIRTAIDEQIQKGTFNIKT